MPLLLKLRRVAAEARRGPGTTEAAIALATLGFVANGAEATIDRGAEQPLHRIGDATFDVVRVAPGIYRSIPLAASRVLLLERARRAAREAVHVHVPITDEGTHAGRALVDAPRALLRRLGAPAPEPGDRFVSGGFVHLFFDEEALEREVAAAGLTVHARRGFTFELRAGAAPNAAARDPFAVEVARVVRALPEAERARLEETPERALARMRRLGLAREERDAIGRARLRRAIGWVDALSPRGASCYRRTLLELALDRGAAREPVVFGLDVGRTGHVAFKDREDRAFDVAFEVGPLDEP